MTHDHALDYAIVLNLLRRGDARYVGLIGSDSKAARFRSRLLREGLTQQDLAPLVCPIGVSGISSKLPAAIAISIAAQLLQSLPLPTRVPTTAPTTVASPPNAGTEQPVTDCTLHGCETCHKKPR
jgi:xanthine dehydrogenase accessory factor